MLVHFQSFLIDFGLCAVESCASLDKDIALSRSCWVDRGFGCRMWAGCITAMHDHHSMRRGGCESMAITLANSPSIALNAFASLTHAGGASRSVSMEGVYRPLTGWMDYGRPWLLSEVAQPSLVIYFNASEGRQYLVTQSQASILSNLATVVLTLASPKLWTLIKTFIIWACSTLIDLSRGRCTVSVPAGSAFGIMIAHTSHGRVLPSSRQTQPIPGNLAANSDSLFQQNLSATETSHSELGAAQHALGNAWNFLRAERVRLPSHERVHQNPWRHSLVTGFERLFDGVLVFWDNFLQKPADVAFSVILAIIFIAIFVAENSGIILSAAILSDTTAIASSPNCSIRMTPNDPWQDPLLGNSPQEEQARRAAAYVNQCYHTNAATALGCNYFYNKSISYKESFNVTCPFFGDYCLSPAYTIDTGLVNARYLGINTRSQYLFRRKTTCAPSSGTSMHHKLRTASERHRILEYNTDGRDSQRLHTQQAQDPLDMGRFRLILYVLCVAIWCLQGQDQLT